MEGNARTRFTPKQRAEVWDRWSNGQCIADIVRAVTSRECPLLARLRPS